MWLVTYRFYVHDFTNRNATGGSPSSALANSGVQVRVMWRQNGISMNRTYKADISENGNFWHVVNITIDDNKKVTTEVINEYSYVNMPFIF